MTGSEGISSRQFLQSASSCPQVTSVFFGAPLMEKIRQGRSPRKLGVESSSEKKSRPITTLSVSAERKPPASAPDAASGVFSAKSCWINSARLSAARHEVKQKLHFGVRFFPVQHLRQVVRRARPGRARN